MSLRQERLRQDYEGLIRYRNPSVLIAASHGSPPEAYELTYLCPGVIDKAMQKRYRHVVDLRMPSDYPYEPPAFVFREPIFHPNVWARGLVCLGDKSLWKPNYLAQHLIAYVGRLIEFQAYNADDPAGNELDSAGWKRWIARHQSELPLAGTTFEDTSEETGGRIRLKRAGAVSAAPEPASAGPAGGSTIRLKRREGSQQPPPNRPTVRLRRRSES